MKFVIWYLYVLNLYEKKKRKQGMTTFLDIVLRKECFNDWKLYKAVPSNLLLKTLKPKCIVSIKSYTYNKWWDWHWSDTIKISCVFSLQGNHQLWNENFVQTPVVWMFNKVLLYLSTDMCLSFYFEKVDLLLIQILMMSC